jgi:hypothetical protein
MGHCKPVVALVADEHFPVPADKQPRQRPVGSETLLQILEHTIDPAAVLRQQPFERRFPPDRLSLDALRLVFFEQVGFRPVPAFDISLDDRAVFDRFDRIAPLDVPVSALRSPEVTVRRNLETD